MLDSWGLAQHRADAWLTLSLLRGLTARVKEHLGDLIPLKECSRGVMNVLSGIAQSRGFWQQWRALEASMSAGSPIVNCLFSVVKSFHSVSSVYWLSSEFRWLLLPLSTCCIRWERWAWHSDLQQFLCLQLLLHSQMCKAWHAWGLSSFSHELSERVFPALSKILTNQEISSQNYIALLAAFHLLIFCGPFPFGLWPFLFEMGLPAS